MIYKFRFLSGENDNFVRDIEIESDKTFFDLHQAIQDSLGYSEGMLASFFLATDCWHKGQEFTLEKMDDERLAMQDIRLEDYLEKEKQKLLYVFDYFNERALFVEFVAKEEFKENVLYPICTRSEGEAPPQFIEPEI